LCAGGLDYGGLAREWFFLLSHEVFDSALGMFEATREYLLQIHRHSGSVDDHLLYAAWLAQNGHHSLWITPFSCFSCRYFQFVGRLLGLALLHHHFIDHAFTRTFYKSMLGLTITIGLVGWGERKCNPAC